MSDQQRLSVEIAADASAALNSFSATTEAAERFDKTVQALSGTLSKFSASAGKARVAPVDDGDVEKIERTLKLYQQLTGAVGGYARASKALADPQAAAGAKKMVDALEGMQSALSKVGTTGDEQYKGMKRTLDMYKSLSTSQKNYAQGLEAEAKAIERITRAETTRRSGGDRTVNQHLGTYQSGGGNRDVTTMTANEAAAWQKLGQQVETANREMQTAIQRRADAQRKAHVEALNNTAAQAASDKKMAGLSVAAEKRRTDAIYARGQAHQRALKGQGNTAIAVMNQELTASQRVDAQREKSLAGEVQATKTRETGLASTRYALYQVAAAYGAASAATLGFSTSAVSSATDMERQFANVERVFRGNSHAMGRMRDELVTLSTQIPVTFEEISQIASLGGQVGVAEANVDQFAEVVSKFVATSEAVQPDQAAMSFGRLSNMLQLTADDYQALASTISELGTSSAATEGEILTITEAIATSGNMAGMSASEVAGMAGALASLRVRPEMARGAMQRIFAQINQVVGEGGERLEEWARTAGLASDEAAEMWRNDPSEFFQRVTQGIAGMSDNIERSNHIREALNVRNVRDIEMLNRLSNGYDVYAASMDLASDSYERADFLDEAFAPIAETMAARLERLGNAIRGMMASFGEGTAVLKPFVEALIWVVNLISSMPDALQNGVLVFSTLIGIFTGLRAAMALGMAAMISFRQVMDSSMIGAGVNVRDFARVYRTTIGGEIPAANARAAASTQAMAATQRAALGSVATSARAASAATVATAGATSTALRGASSLIKGFGIPGLVILGVSALTSLGTAIYNFTKRTERAEEQARALREEIVEFAGGAQAVYAAVAQDQADFASGAQDVADAQGEITVSTSVLERATRDGGDATAEFATIQDDAKDSVEDATEALELQTVAYGKHTQELLNTAIAQRALDRLMDEDNFDRGQFTALLEDGFDFEQFTQIAGTEGQNAAQAFVQGHIDALEAEHARLAASYDEAIAEFMAGDAGAGERAKSIASEMDAIYALVPAYRALAEEAVTTDADLESLNFKLEANAAFGLGAADANEELEESLDGVGDSAEDAFDSLSKFVGELFKIIDAEAAVEESLYRLGQAIIENDLDFSTTTENGRANLDALQGALSSYAAYLEAQVADNAISAAEAGDMLRDYMHELFDELEQMGVDPAVFDEFRDHLAYLFEENPISPQFDLTDANAQLTTYVSNAHAAAEAAYRALGPVAENATLPTGITFAGQTFTQPTGTAGRLLSQAQRPGRTTRQVRSRQPAPLSSFISGVQQAQSEAAERAADDAARANQEAQREAQNLAREQKRAADEARKLGEEAEKAGDKAVSAYEKAQDYAKRLGEAFSESFERRYGMQQAQDAVEMQFIRMRERAEQAREEVQRLREESKKMADEARRHRNEAAGHRNDARQAQLFADVAGMYGDDIRAAEYTQQAKEARLAAKESDNLAKASDREAKQLSATSRELDRNRNALTGNTKEAIENRAEVYRLQQAMADLVIEYAKTGASQQEVRRFAGQLEDRFRTQVTQMGYNRTEVGRLAGRFQDLRRDIDNVPRNVSIRAEATNIDRTRRQINDLARGRDVPLRFTGGGQNITASGNLSVRELLANKGRFNEMETRTVHVAQGGGGGSSTGRMQMNARGGVIQGRTPISRSHDNMVGTIAGGGLASFQGGEGVVNYAALQHYGGREWLSAVNNMRLPRHSPIIVGAGASAPDVQVVDLMPHTLKKLANAVSTQLNLDGRVVASATNRNNVNSARRGAN